MSESGRPDGDRNSSSELSPPAEAYLDQVTAEFGSRDAMGRPQSIPATTIPLRILNDPMWETGHWRYCPPIIPALWREWWVVPVCGSAQAPIRYAQARDATPLLSTPLPYELKRDFVTRTRQGVSTGYAAVEAVWLAFNEKYPEWAAIGNRVTADGLELPDMPLSLENWLHLPTPGLSTDSDDGLRDMLSRYDLGQRWGDIPGNFPDLPRPVALVMYLWATRSEGNRRLETEDTLLQAEMEHVSQGAVNKPPWSFDETKVLQALRSYGFSWFAIAPEVGLHTPLDCRDRCHYLEQAARGFASNLRF